MNYDELCRTVRDVGASPRRAVARTVKVVAVAVAAGHRYEFRHLGNRGPFTAAPGGSAEQSTCLIWLMSHGALMKGVGSEQRASQRTTGRDERRREKVAKEKLY
eukprot:Skav228283  [mRNA]  locus=scaffold1313:99233:100990:+ [translate_table: standard]